MKPRIPRNSLLTVSDVASLAGVSVDTVRNWDRDGLLRARRTPGGQRRYPKLEAEAFLRKKMGLHPSPPQSDAPIARRPSGGRGSGRPSRALIREIETRARSPRDPLLEDARSELEILKAQHQSESIRRAMKDEAAETARRAEEERLRRESSERLQELKHFGRSLASALPPDWRARVVTDLEGYVTAQQFPAALSERDARAFIAARVEGYLKRHRALVEQQQENERRQRRLEQLIRGGEDFALNATVGWDHVEGERARQTVKRELQGQVEPAWTELDVQDLVNDVLVDCRRGEDEVEESEFDDADDEDEDDDQGEEDDDPSEEDGSEEDDDTEDEDWEDQNQEGDEEDW